MLEDKLFLFIDETTGEIYQRTKVGTNELEMQEAGDMKIFIVRDGKFLTVESVDYDDLNYTTDDVEVRP